MSEYQKLTYAERAKLANEDPDGYTKIKGEHDRAVARVEQLMASAKTHGEYSSALAELQRLSGAAGAAQPQSSGAQPGEPPTGNGWSEEEIYAHAIRGTRPGAGGKC